ncbi:hypothetical protein ACHAWF_008704, partial [Thalassiosira exigua]
ERTHSAIGAKQPPPPPPPPRRFGVACGFVLLARGAAFAPSKRSPLRLPRPPPSPSSTKRPVRLRGASADDDDGRESPAAEEVRFVAESLLRNSLFEDLADASLASLAGLFERRTARRGDLLVRQGDSASGDYVYLLAEGRCEVVVDGSVVPGPYGAIGPGEVFGELGVLYSEPRASTVRVASAAAAYYRARGDGVKESLGMSDEALADLRAIDDAINRVSGTDALYGGDVILPYRPERLWLWRRFDGTVLKISLGPTLVNMALCAAFVVYARHCAGDPLFEVGAGAPDPSSEFVQKLDLVGKIWDLDRTLTSFVLTFFVSQSYGFWNKIYQLARDIQGEINDVNLLVVTNVKRDEDGALLPESDALIEDISHYSRLFHILMWAGKAKRFSALATPSGLKRLESRGIMDRRELDALRRSNLPNDRLFMAPLEWMAIRAVRAMDAGTLAGDNATKGQLLKAIVTLRAKQRAVADGLAGRMPLAYVNFVQVLVDAFAFTAPLALYSRLGDYSVIAVGTLTIFYTGLNNLAKIFLDPLNNEDFSSDSIFMDLGVFLRETNGQSVQWKEAGEELPF